MIYCIALSTDRAYFLERGRIRLWKETIVKNATHIPCNPLETTNTIAQYVSQQK